MGWLIYSSYNSPETYAQERAEIERLCSFETDDRKAAPVQLSKVGNVWYAAIKVLPKVGKPMNQSTFQHDADGGYTFAAIFLTTRQNGEWGYKDMDETMGPNESKAPVSLLRRLSTLNDPDGYATRWRERCMRWAENKPPALKSGDTIRTRPIELANGGTIQNFRVETYRRRGQNRKIYQCLDDGFTYSLKRRHLEGTEILS